MFKNIILLICSLSIIGCSNHKKIEPEDNLKVMPTQPLDNQNPLVEEDLLGELKNINPFFPEHSLGAAQSAGQGIGLKGIVWDSKRPYAVIGYQVVVEGDEVDGKKVIKINRNSVELDNNGSREIIKLK